MNTLFILWSAYSGQPNIDTPAMIPSSTEFHPHGPVVEHVHLRCPPLADKPAAIGSLHEPLRQERMEVRVVVVDTLGVSYHRPLQPNGDLPDLLLRVAHLSYAPEAEEHDTAVRLPVMPREAAVPRCLCSLAGLLDQRPDIVQRSQHHAGRKMSWMPDVSFGQV
ncbi:hypothetical protein TRIUR3_07048 [Triticum urartu]|uniref:Uncharacterized protein n=1 Tax=Triticum urartu TaxID=4572 RepID=M7Z4I7_TRIUA|nr:hypothetical protein TRIUR3_07048 [Triticum urartu]